MKRVKLRDSLADMCKVLIDSGQKLSFSNEHIYPSGLFDFSPLMRDNLGKEIILDNNMTFEGRCYSYYMYTEITPSFRQFTDILEIPEGAIFREKKSPLSMFRITNQFDSTGNIIFCCGSSGMSGKVLIDDCEMTIDRGLNWTVAGVEE